MLKKIIPYLAICHSSFANDPASNLREKNEITFQEVVFAWMDRHDSTINALMPSTCMKKATKLAVEFVHSELFPKVFTLAVFALIFSNAYYQSLFDAHVVYRKSGHYIPENAKFSPYDFEMFSNNRKLLSNETSAHLVSLPYAAAPLDTREYLFESQLNADFKLQQGLVEYKEKGAKCGESRDKFDEIFLKCMQSAKKVLKATVLPTCGIFIEDGAETTWRCVAAQAVPSSESSQQCHEVKGYDNVVALYDSKTDLIIARPNQQTATQEKTQTIELPPAKHTPTKEQTRSRSKMKSKTLKLSRTISQEASKSQSIPGTLSIGNTKTITMLVKLQQSSTQTKTSQYPIDIFHPQPYTEEYCREIYPVLVKWLLMEPKCNPISKQTACFIKRKVQDNLEVGFYIMDNFDKNKLEITLENPPYSYNSSKVFVNNHINFCRYYIYLNFELNIQLAMFRFFVTL